MRKTLLNHAIYNQISKPLGLRKNKQKQKIKKNGKQNKKKTEKK